MGGVDMKEVELMELKYWDSRDYKLKFSLEVDNNKKIKESKKCSLLAKPREKYWQIFVRLDVA